MSDGPGSGPTSSIVEVDGILAQLPEIPTVPGVLVRIWALADDPATSVADLEKVVRVEPPLAAKVLRLANSAYFGGRGRVRSVHSAITVLGFDTLRNLAVGLSVADSVERAAGHASLHARQLWRHSVATGVLAKRLAQDLDLAAPEELFTAGLLHDVGMVVIAMSRPQAYAEIIGRVMDRGLSLVAAEREVLGFDHSRVGEAVARAWAFPTGLQALIRSHHECPREAPLPAQALALADGLSQTWLETMPLPQLPPEAPAPTLPGVLGIDARWLEARKDAYLEEIASADTLVALV